VVVRQLATLNSDHQVMAAAAGGRQEQPPGGCLGGWPPTEATTSLTLPPEGMDRRKLPKFHLPREFFKIWKTHHVRHRPGHPKHFHSKPWTEESFQNSTCHRRFSRYEKLTMSGTGLCTTNTGTWSHGQKKAPKIPPANEIFKR